MEAAVCAVTAMPSTTHRYRSARERDARSASAGIRGAFIVRGLREADLLNRLVAVLGLLGLLKPPLARLEPPWKCRPGAPTCRCRTACSRSRTALWSASPRAGGPDRAG